jgi:CBS domain-containing protein
MTPVSRLAAVPPLTPALTVLEEMDTRSVNELPVISQGALLGVITRLHLVRPLELKRRSSA